MKINKVFKIAPVAQQVADTLFGMPLSTFEEKVVNKIEEEVSRYWAGKNTRIMRQDRKVGKFRSQIMAEWRNIAPRLVAEAIDAPTVEQGNVALGQFRELYGQAQSRLTYLCLQAGMRESIDIPLLHEFREGEAGTAHAIWPVEKDGKGIRAVLDADPEDLRAFLMEYSLQPVREVLGTIESIPDWMVDDLQDWGDDKRVSAMKRVFAGERVPTLPQCEFVIARLLNTVLKQEKRLARLIEQAEEKATRRARIATGKDGEARVTKVGGYIDFSKSEISNNTGRYQDESEWDYTQSSAARRRLESARSDEEYMRIMNANALRQTSRAHDVVDDADDGAEDKDVIGIGELRRRLESLPELEERVLAAHEKLREYTLPFAMYRRNMARPPIYAWERIVGADGKEAFSPIHDRDEAIAHNEKSFRQWAADRAAKRMETFLANVSKNVDWAKSQLK